MYCGFVVEIDNLHKHPNADRLQITNIFGNSVIVDMNTHEGTVGVFFPVDGQLSEEFCEVNDLCWRLDADGCRCGGYLDPRTRHIKAIRIRGEKSEGLFLPITCLANFCKISSLEVGNTISVVNGQEICCKYIPYRKEYRRYNSSKNKKTKENICPVFHQHVETEQLAYNLDKFKAGDVIELTLKIHGTSGRTGYLPVAQPQNFIAKMFGLPKKFKYDFVSGSRRVILPLQGNACHATATGYYNDNTFRYQAEDLFRHGLRKGETAYYEIAGFTTDGTPIMSTVFNKETHDKNFIKMYGEETTFSYGCEPHPHDFSTPQHRVFVYRMSMVNEDGYEVDYSPEQMRRRCEEIGVECVPQFETVVIPDFVDDKPVNPGEFVLKEVEKFYDGPDPIGKTHVREGVVVRIVNHPSFEVYKHKNFSFKVIEGIAKTDANQPDMEEMEEVI